MKFFLLVKSLHYDGLNASFGNIRVTIDEESNVKAYDDFYPYGMQMPYRSFNDGNTSDPYKYSSKELDEENGLDWYYFGARFYDPAIGRWLSVDPLASHFPREGPYNHVNNDPINCKRKNDS